MIKVRCKDCNVEITSHPTKTKCCGCSNIMTVKGNQITATDLSRVVMISSLKETKNKNILSESDLAYQEARRNRKIRKLDFEIR
jgi:hypothetical protein